MPPMRPCQLEWALKSPTFLGDSTGSELTSMVWLNGEFRTKPWTQVVSGATPSPLDLHVDEVSGDESTEPEGT